MKPDFSGEWVLDREACTLSPGADAIRKALVRIEHREAKFKYESEFVSDTGTMRPAFELVIEPKAETASGASLLWDGDALLFTYIAEDETMTFRYELIEGGRRLRAVEKLRAGTHSQDNVWIFNRALIST